MFQKIKKIFFQNKINIYVLLLFLTIAIIFNFNLILNFFDKIPGSSSKTDYYQFFNILWWTKYSTLNLINPFYTNLYYFPQEFNFIFTTFTYLQGIISIPIQLVSNLYASCNFIYLTSFVISGYSTYLLVYYLTKSRLAGVFSGLAFAFSPYVFGHALTGHLNLINIWVFPLTIYTFLRSIDGSKKFIVFLGISLALTAYTDMQYLMFLFIFIFLYFLYDLFTDYKQIFKKISRFILGIIIFLILSSPVIYYSYKALIQANFTKDVDMLTYMNGDLATFFWPNPLNPVIGKQTKILSTNLAGALNENVNSISYILLLLTIFTLIFVKKNNKKWFWFYIFIIFFILAIGPKLQYRGEIISTSLYFHLEDIFPFSIGLVPPRFIVVAILSLSIIAGYAIKYIFDNKNLNNNSKKCLFFCLFFLLLFEYFPGKIPLIKLKKPPNKIIEISKEKDDFSIISIPNRLFSSYYQISHQKKIIGGNMGRRADNKFLRYY